MNTLNITTILGARPQFVKAAMVSRARESLCPDTSERMIHTGQHFDDNMSRVFFDELGLREPDINLGIGGGTHGRNTGRMIEQIESALLSSRPDWVVVYGDTDSTLAGTLAAVKLHIPVAHVESGLRSYNRRMPEEINRILTDHASDRLYTPTVRATSNLAAEGIRSARIVQVGDVMCDAALHYGDVADRRSRILDRLGFGSKEYTLVTLHRAENTDDRHRLKCILAGLERSGETAIWPMHPRTRKQMEAFGLHTPGNIQIIAPIGYLDMVTLEKNASIIATDSGGVQKEAYFHRVPCVTLRDETEWVELIEAGCNRLTGANPDTIAGAIVAARRLTDINWPEGIYGLGDASERIVMDLFER